MSKRRPVKRLDASVVNRIAAGEVVKRPANALKEMLENSLDAGATSIQVLAKDGGMKFLQIQDNGSGIAKEDLSVVCERFTTSKLENFDDLRSINTYGFRGEALASISHISHLTIVTKTDEERCGYKTSYLDGKMNGSPIPCGVNRGTQITVENMFYNVPTRHKMLKNFNEEFSRIRDVVARYAIHNASVGFSLKKYNRDEMYVKTLPNSSCTDNIRSIFGNIVSRDLIEAKEMDDALQFRFHVLTTSLDYHAPQLTFLLFINHRLVDAEGLRKELDALYGLYLPQGTHPFIYISLEMAPENVDVNVHPTKHSVFYLYEDAINKKIRTTVQKLILGKQNSRNFTLQIVSPLSMTNPLTCETSTGKNKPEQYPYEKVRINASDQKIDRFLQFETKLGNEIETSNNIHEQISLLDTENENSISDLHIENQSEAAKNEEENPSLLTRADCISEDAEDIASACTVERSDSKLISMSNVRQVETSFQVEGIDNVDNIPIESNSKTNENCDEDCTNSITPVERREFSLTSLERLRKQVVDTCDHELKRVLRGASYVGCLDYRYMLMQHSTNLYLCDINNLCEAFFYQLMLCEFGNFGVMKLSQPLKLSSLLESAMNGKEYASSAIEILCDCLRRNSDMLEDYFSIKIDDKGRIHSFPWLLQQYSPCIKYFPEYVLKLATEVNWEEEQFCFQGICQKTAWFYSQIPSKQEQCEKNKEWNWILEHIIFPHIKRNVYPPKSFIENLSLCHITRFRDLFSVFERC